MTLRTITRSRTFTGAFLALGMVAGLALMPNVAHGQATVSLTDPNDVTVYTLGAALPSSILVPTTATSDANATGVTFEVVGGSMINDGIDGPPNWFGIVNLLDDPAAASPGFTSTVRATATSSDYYANPDTATDDQDVMVTILDVTAIDADSNGIPDVSALPGIASNPGVVTQIDVVGQSGNTITTYATGISSSAVMDAYITSAATAATYYNAASGADFPGTTIGMEITTQDLATIQGLGGNAPAATQAVALVTVATNSGDLTSDADDNPGAEIVELLGAFVRIVILHNGGAGMTWEQASDAEVEIFAGVDGVELTAVHQYDRALTLSTMGENISLADSGMWNGPDSSTAPVIDARQIDAFASTFVTVPNGLGIIGWDIDGTVVASGGGGSGGTCFIATAAFGTPMAEEINTLRQVRDTYLLNNVAGTAFVDTYYRLSPAIADKVAESPLFAAVVRAILTPFILVGKLIIGAPMALMLLMVSGAGLLLAHRRTRKS